LDNLSSGEPFVVEDLEDPEQRIAVPPGRIDVAIPFELARLTAAAASSHLLTVFGPEPQRAVAALTCPAPPPRGTEISTDAMYFAVLVRLCARRLSGDVTAPPPTATEISASLEAEGLHVSPRAVEGHIDYLIEKLGLVRASSSGAKGRSWKKEALIRVAIARGLVPPDRFTGVDGRIRLPA
jgi:hypothetical protein